MFARKRKCNERKFKKIKKTYELIWANRCSKVQFKM